MRPFKEMDTITYIAIIMNSSWRIVNVVLAIDYIALCCCAENLPLWRLNIKLGICVAVVRSKGEWRHSKFRMHVYWQLHSVLKYYGQHPSVRPPSSIQYVACQQCDAAVVLPSYSYVQSSTMQTASVGWWQFTVDIRNRQSRDLMACWVRSKYPDLLSRDAFKLLVFSVYSVTGTPCWIDWNAWTQMLQKFMPSSQWHARAQ